MIQSEFALTKYTPYLTLSPYIALSGELWLYFSSYPKEKDLEISRLLCIMKCRLTRDWTGSWASKFGYHPCGNYGRLGINPCKDKNTFNKMWKLIPINNFEIGDGQINFPDPQRMMINPTQNNTMQNKPHIYLMVCAVYVKSAAITRNLTDTLGSCNRQRENPYRWSINTRAS